MNLKQRLKNGEIVLGSWNVIPSPTVTEALSLGGLDFVVVDMEHGPQGPETAENMIRAAEAAGIDAIVRVPDNQPHLILKALDIGPHGVQVPQVATKAEAEQAVSASKYHPLGMRGLSPFTRAGRYGMKAEGHTDRVNRLTMVVINIEGVQGINNLDEIASVSEVDVVFVGPYDLSQSMGKPGQIMDSEVIAAVRETAAKLEDRGVACGSFTRDPKHMEILIDCGVRYITYGVDTDLLTSTVRSVVDKFSHLKSKKDGLN